MNSVLIPVFKITSCIFIIFFCLAPLKTTEKSFAAWAQNSEQFNEPFLQKKAQLKIEITGYKETRGILRVLLFQSGSGFPSSADRAIQSKSVQLDPEKTIVVFEGLELNQNYAAAVLEDQNENGKLDKNFLGIPKEGIAVSGNPNLWLGEPTFKESAVPLTQPSTLLKMKLQHF